MCLQRSDSRVTSSVVPPLCTGLGGRVLIHTIPLILCGSSLPWDFPAISLLGPFLSLFILLWNQQNVLSIAEDATQVEARKTSTPPSERTGLSVILTGEGCKGLVMAAPWLRGRENGSSGRAEPWVPSPPGRRRDHTWKMSRVVTDVYDMFREH